LTQIQGPMGTQGVVGPVGAQGSQGTQGIPGKNGGMGSNGIQGATGAQGLTGNPGVQGHTGALGAQGVSGHDYFAFVQHGKITLANGIATVVVHECPGDVDVFLQNVTGWDLCKPVLMGNQLTVECSNKDSQDTISYLVLSKRNAER